MPTLKAKQPAAATASKPASGAKTGKQAAVKRAPVKRTATMRSKPRVAASLAASTVVSSTDQVAERAYFYWLERGCPHGSAQDDWLRAEQDLGLRN